MSQTGTIGAIGPIQATLVKIVNGYIEGAKSVNPFDIDVKHRRTNSYVDTQLAQESARHDRGRHRRHR